MAFSRIRLHKIEGLEELMLLAYVRFSLTPLYSRNKAVMAFNMSPTTGTAFMKSGAAFFVAWQALACAPTLAGGFGEKIVQRIQED